MKFCRFDKETRTAIRNTTLDGSGCEKVITYADLSKWAIGIPMGCDQIVVCKLCVESRNLDCHSIKNERSIVLNC